VEASQARVFQSDLKTGGGTAWMVHMASSRRFRRVQAKDGRVDCDTPSVTVVATVP
jgi:hypothetical protein